MNLDGIDTGKKGGKRSTLRVSLHSSIDVDEIKHQTPSSAQKRRARHQNKALKTIAMTPNKMPAIGEEKTLLKNTVRT